MPDPAMMRRLRTALRSYVQERAQGATVRVRGDVAAGERLLGMVNAGAPATVFPRCASITTGALTIPEAPFRADDYTIGLWHLDADEYGYGTVVTDASAYGNDGTVEGDFAWGSGKFSNALLPTDALVTVPDAPSLDVGAAFTLQAWVKTSAAGTIAERDGWKVYVDAGAHLCLDVGADTIVSTATIPADTWTHVLAQFGDGELWVAVGDVVKRQATAITSIPASSEPLYLANDAADADPLVGALDEVWLSAVARFRSDGRLTRVRSAPGDVAVFNFEEGVGATAYNARVAGPVMALHGTSWGVGRTGGGLVFDGAASWAEFTPSASTPSALSVGGWFKFATADGPQTLLAQTGGVGLVYTGSALRLPLAGISNTNVDVAIWQPEPDVWHEIYGVADGSTKAIWIDGHKWGEIAGVGTPTISGNACVVGAAVAGGDYFEGTMDDLVVARCARRPYRRVIVYAPGA